MRIWCVAAAMLVAGVSGCGGGDGDGGTTPSGGGRTNNPVMRNTAFVPTPDTVTAGATVRWTNNDGFAHTVTSVPGSGESFDSGNVAGAGTFSRAFNTAGTFNYYCTIHGTPTSGMRGTIVVE